MYFQLMSHYNPSVIVGILKQFSKYIVYVTPSARINRCLKNLLLKNETFGGKAINCQTDLHIFYFLGISNMAIRVCVLFGTSAPSIAHSLLRAFLRLAKKNDNNNNRIFR